MEKKLIIIVCLFNICISLYSQNYIAEYYSGDEAKTPLLFNSNEWRYDVIGEGTTEFSSNEAELQDDLPPSTSKTITLFNFRSLSKNYYLDEEIIPDFTLQNKYVIKGELIKPDWTIVSDSIKTIENYTCLMAKGNVRGRDYTVWFTPDIPVSAGPWKLWGLPGLIVSAQSDDKMVNFYMISFKKTDKEPVEPIVKATVTHEEYKILFNDAIKKLSRSIRATNESIDIDVKISVSDNYPDKTLLE